MSPPLRATSSGAWRRRVVVTALLVGVALLAGCGSSGVSNGGGSAGGGGGTSSLSDNEKLFCYVIGLVQLDSPPKLSSIKTADQYAAYKKTIGQYAKGVERATSLSPPSIKVAMGQLDSTVMALQAVVQGSPTLADFQHNTTIKSTATTVDTGAAITTVGRWVGAHCPSQPPTT